jgi:hypothetical protein
MASVLIRHFGRITHSGKLFFYELELWNQQLQTLAGKEFEIIIKEKHKRPTVNQFSYYWGGILKTCLTCEQFSHYTTVEELHKEVFQPMFLAYQVRVVVGKKKFDKVMVKSLSELNKQETADFIDNVLNFLAMEGITILPKDNYVEKYYREINLTK